MLVDVEPTIRQLALKNCVYGLSIRSALGRSPDTVHGGMEPELHQNVIRFES